MSGVLGLSGVSSGFDWLGSLGEQVRTGGLRVSIMFTDGSRYEILTIYFDFVNVCKLLNAFFGV